MHISAVNIIGGGKLGQQLGHQLLLNKLTPQLSICNQSLTSALQAVDAIGGGQAIAQLADLPAADIYWLCVPDDQIPKVVDQLILSNSLPMGCTLIHSSGALTADVMNASKTYQCQLISCHPMKSFAQLDLSPQALNDTYCAIEGDASAIQHIQQWLSPLHLKWLAIASENKTAYHAAGVFASNYLISIAAAACEQLKLAGIEQSTAIDVVHQLMQGTLNNINKTQCLSQSLTGPLQRGDINTIERHLETMGNREQKQLYATLGRNIIELTQHNEDFKSQINALLLGYS